MSKSRLGTLGMALRGRGAIVLGAAMTPREGPRASRMGTLVAGLALWPMQRSGWVAAGRVIRCSIA